MSKSNLDNQIKNIKEETKKQKTKVMIGLAVGGGVIVFCLLALLINSLFFGDQTQKYLDAKTTLKEQFTTMATNTQFNDDPQKRMEFVTEITGDMKSTIEKVNCDKVEEERQHECERVQTNVVDLDKQANEVLDGYKENGDQLTPELNSSIENFGSTLEVVRRLLGVELR